MPSQVDRKESGCTAGFHIQRRRRQLSTCRANQIILFRNSGLWISCATDRGAGSYFGAEYGGVCLNLVQHLGPVVRLTTGVGLPFQHALFDDKGNHLIQSLTGFEVGEHEGSLAPHPAGIALHDLEGSAHIRGQINFVDDQQV